MSSIGAFIMLFLGLIIITGSVFMIYGTLLSNSQAMSEQQEQQRNAAQTSISIINVTFHAIAGDDITELWIYNDGSRKVRLDDIDVYLDDELIPRDDSRRSIAMLTNSTINPLHLDPGETLAINVTKELDGGSHVAVAATEYGAISSRVFTAN